MNAVMDHTDAIVMQPAAIQTVAMNVVVVVVLLAMGIPVQVSIKHFFPNKFQKLSNPKLTLVQTL